MDVVQPGNRGANEPEPKFVELRKPGKRNGVTPWGPAKLPPKIELIETFERNGEQDLIYGDPSAASPAEVDVPREVPFSKRYHRPRYHSAKRVFDIFAASFFLLLLFPVFLVVSVLVMIGSGLPVAFKQKRVGYKGQPFFIYKFRTMVRNAEQILAARPDLLEEYKKNFKIENDPRISKLGHFLRKSSLDELPQLINVIKGDMSLVGPRPIVIPELEKYGEYADMYLAMRPGCTGLWQCGGRSATTYQERIALDKEYFEKAGLRFDLYIIFKTIGAIFTGRGAR